MRRKIILLSISIVLVTCQNSKDKNYTTTGTIEAYQIDVRASAPGKVVYHNIPEGTRVAENHLLAVIDTTDLHLQREQLLTKIDGLPVQLRSLENKEEQLNIRLGFLEKQVNRLNELVAANGVSQDKLDKVLMERDVVKAQLKDIPNQRRSIVNQREQILKQIDLLKYRIEQSSITAPAAGRILQRYVEPGERIQPGHLLATIGLTDTVWTMIYIPEPMLAHIKLGQIIPVQPDGKPGALKGTVEWIGAEAEFTPKTVYTEDTRTSLTYSVRVSIPNPAGVLKIGMPVLIQVKALQPGSPE